MTKKQQSDFARKFAKKIEFTVEPNFTEVMSSARSYARTSSSSESHRASFAELLSVKL